MGWGFRTIALAAAGAASAPVSASALADRLCTDSAPAALARFPTDASLLSAAESAEQRLDQERVGAAAASGLEAQVAALDVAADQAKAPAAASLARYCSAAGELMRVSPDGSQNLAQTYLMTALRRSLAAQLSTETAQAAYRLGLVSVSGAALSGTRGVAPVRRDGGTIVRKLRSAEAADGSAQICSALGDVQVEDSSDASLSMLALDCSARIALQAGSPALASLARLRFARFAIDWSKSSDDPEALRKVGLERALSGLPVAGQVAEPGLKAELVGRLARTAIELGGADDPRLAEAIATLQREAREPIGEAVAAELAARLALKRGDKASAARLLQGAILQESGRPVPLRLPEYFLLLAQAEPQQRLRHVSAAYAALENIRPRLPRLDPLTEESTFSLYMRRVFEAAADAQLAAASSGDDDGHIRSAQQIVEAFRQAELQSAVGSECLPVRNAVDATSLVRGETLLYPLLFADRVEIITVSGASGDRRFRRLPANFTTNRQEVAGLVEAFVVSLTRGEDDSWKAPARKLYDIFIAPVEAQLGPGSSLAIVPDGPLRSVPFAALLAPDGKFLVERTAISVAPALAYSQPGAGHARNRVSILAASLQKRVTVSGLTFAALSGTATEAQIAASNGSPGRLVRDFTRDELVTALAAEPFDVLHLATHASFNGRSDRAFIVANGGAIRLSELRDLIGRNRARGDELGLLVLSACETAIGDDEASMGLAGAAVQAGALSAIASLWQVDDAGTAELMRGFYGNYRAGQSRAEALRQAQLALIRHGGNNADPYVWAAFTLLGAWR